MSLRGSILDHQHSAETALLRFIEKNKGNNGHRNESKEQESDKDSGNGGNERQRGGFGRRFHEIKAINTDIHQYAREGDLSRIKVTLQYVSKPELQNLICGFDNDLLTPLHYASRYGHVHVMKFLLDNGADVNACNRMDRMTPLHLAARYNIKKEVGEPIKSSASRKTKPTQEEKVVAEIYSKAGTGIQKHSHLAIFLLLYNGARTEMKDRYGLTPLHYAAMKHNICAVRELLRHKCDIKIKDQDQLTALHTAAAHGSKDIVTLLLDAGADVSATDNRKNTVLHLAAKNGHFNIVKCVLESAMVKDEDKTWLLKCKNRDQDTPLHLAVDADDLDILNYYPFLSNSNVNETRAQNNTALHSAAGKGYVEMVAMLLEAGAVLTAVNSSEETPLHKAAASGRIEVIRYMLSKDALSKVKLPSTVVNDADSNLRCCGTHSSLIEQVVFEAVDKKGMTPFLVAVSKDHTATAKALYDGGANTTAKDYEERDCIFLAAQYNCVETLKFLLREVFRDVDPEVRNVIDTRNHYSETPLHVAAANGFIEICKELYEHKADLGLQNEEEETPMHYAAKAGRKEIVEQFLEWNSKTLADKDESFNTPLHLAASEGHAQVVEVLLDAGADIAARSVTGETALDCAVTCGRLSTVKVLLDKGAPTEPDLHGITPPLHRAARFGHADIIRALLDRNAEVDRHDKRGRTCLDVAIRHNQRECCMAILQHKDWSTAMRTSAHQVAAKNRLSPLRHLIRKLPEVAEAVFDNCLCTTGNQDEENFKVVCNYEFLDDSYLSPNQPIIYYEDGTKEQMCALAEGSSSPYDSDGKLAEKAYLYSNDYDEIMQNHPLTIMVQSQRLHLLSHPLVEYLIRRKWNKLGCFVYCGGLAFYAVFLLMLTLFVVEQSAPFNVQEILDAKLEFREVLRNETACKLLSLRKEHLGYVYKLPLPIIILAVGQLIKEGYQLYQRRFNYLKFENFLEVIVPVLSIITVADFTACSRTTGLRMDWQWIVAGFCIFLAWINLLFMIRKLPGLGIYVVMFIDVMRTFTKCFTIFALFVIAFSMAFYVWLQNKPQFGNLGWALFKSTMMMIGEIDFGDLFFGDNAEDAEGHIFTDPWLHIFLFAFVIIITILTMNLLVGLAVDDIQSVQEKAELTRKAMQVDLVLNVERILHGIHLSKILRWAVVGKETIYPNRLSCMARLWRRLGFSSTPMLFAVGASHEETDSILDLKKNLEEARQEIQGLRKHMEEEAVHRQLQDHLLETILQRLDGPS